MKVFKYCVQWKSKNNNDHWRVHQGYTFADDEIKAMDNVRKDEGDYDNLQMSEVKTIPIH